MTGFPLSLYSNCFISTHSAELPPPPPPGTRGDSRIATISQRGLTDLQEVVIDEVAGQLLAMAGHITSPAAGGLILPRFILFRIFDIVKP